MSTGEGGLLGQNLAETFREFPEGCVVIQQFSQYVGRPISPKDVVAAIFWLYPPQMMAVDCLDYDFDGEGDCSSAREFKNFRFDHIESPVRLGHRTSRFRSRANLRLHG